MAVCSQPFERGSQAVNRLSSQERKAMALSHLGGQRFWEALIVNGDGRGLWASEKSFPTAFVLQNI